MSKDQVITQAKNLLLNQPFDIAHDIFHHYQVWENALFITVTENLALDLDKLEIAAWWHDYERGSNEHLILQKTMQECGYDLVYIQTVKDLINSHSFADQRSESTEAKVLFDADKIEYVNPARWLWIGEGIAHGLLDSQVGRQYSRALQARILTVISTLHYPTTRSLFQSNLNQLIAILPQLHNRYPDFMSDVQKEVLLEAQGKL